MQNMETSADKPDDRKPRMKPITGPGMKRSRTRSKGAAEALDAGMEDDDPELEDAAEDRIQALMTENADLRDKLLRALAEAENVRRRAEREKTDAQRFAVTRFARDLLAVADNLNRALLSTDAEARKSSEALENLCVGVEMTERELLSAFKSAGIETVSPEDEVFDHNVHEALFEVEDPSKPAGTVLQVVERGYLLNNRLLRPAKVGIAKGGSRPFDRTKKRKRTERKPPPVEKPMNNGPIKPRPTPAAKSTRNFNRPRTPGVLPKRLGCEKISPGLIYRHGVENGSGKHSKTVRGVVLTTRLRSGTPDKGTKTT